MDRSNDAWRLTRPVLSPSGSSADESLSMISQPMRCGSSVVVSCLMLVAAGTGSIRDGTGDDRWPGSGSDMTGGLSSGNAPAGVARRLSIREYNDVVASLIYDTSRP